MSFAALALLALAVLSVAGVKAKRKAREDAWRAKRRAEGEEQIEEEGEEEERPTIHISETLAVVFFVQASVMLVLMFFFLNKFFFTFIVVVFALIGVDAVFTQLQPVLRWLCRTDKTLALPWLGPTPLVSAASLLLSLALCASWAALRTKWQGAWALQDVMGACLLVQMLELLHLPSLRIAWFVCPLLVFYDVFFVYIEPAIFKGQSVMERVATGGAAHEIMPMLLLFPNFLQPAHPHAPVIPGFAMLGYGDVVIPGLLLCYAARFDETVEREALGAGRREEGNCACKRTWRQACCALASSYFALELFWYAAGMAMTYGALVLRVGGQRGQPALLYLIPCTLLPLTCAAWWRGHLARMMAKPEPKPSQEGGEDESAALLESQA